MSWGCMQPKSDCKFVPVLMCSNPLRTFSKPLEREKLPDSEQVHCFDWLSPESMQRLFECLSQCYQVLLSPRQAHQVCQDLTKYKVSYLQIHIEKYILQKVDTLYATEMHINTFQPN